MGKFRQNLLFLIAGGVELTLDVVFVVNAIMNNPVAIGAAVVRLVCMGTFVLVALRGRLWGRWCFIILSALTACTTWLFSFVALKDGAHLSFSPLVLLISLVYVSITTLASIDTRSEYRRRKAGVIGEHRADGPVGS
jgi:uncharacterized membrane protein